MATHPWPELRLRPPPQPARIVIANRKGGSGKTTTAVHLAAAYAAWGLRVGLIDGDPQLGSATYWLPPLWPDPEGYRPTLLNLFTEDQGLPVMTLPEVLFPTSVPRVQIVPAVETLGRVDVDRPPAVELLLARHLDEAPAGLVDVWILDCQGNIGAVTVAMLAAGRLLVVTQRVSSLDYAGAAELNKPVKAVQDIYRTRLVVAAVVLIAANPQATYTGTMLAAVRQQYPGALVHSVPHSVRATEAPGVHQSLFTFAPDNPVASAYWQLAARAVPLIGAEWASPRPDPAWFSPADLTAVPR
jgi:chromosome partitioning protein